MSDMMQIAVNRLIRAAHMRGMATRLNKTIAITDAVDTELYGNVTRAESAVLALYEEQKAIADKLAEAERPFVDLLNIVCNRIEMRLTYQEYTLAGLLIKQAYIALDAYNKARSRDEQSR